MRAGGISTHGGEYREKTPETPVIPESLSSTRESARGLPRGYGNQTPASSAALLGTLEGLGVSISVTPEGKLRLQPFSLVPAELLEEIQAHRADLLAELGYTEEKPQDPAPQEPPGYIIFRHSPSVPALPSPLASMVGAAASGNISGGAKLPSGIVVDLSAYVLAWAAAYLTSDQTQALARLTEARAAWRPL